MNKVGYRKILVTQGPANVRQQISTKSIKTSQVEIYIPAGSAVFYLGNKDVDSTWIPRSVQSLTTFTASDGAGFTDGDYFDLSKLYLVSATVGATAIVQYLDREEA